MSPAILLINDEEKILEFLERRLLEKYTVFKTEDPAAIVSMPAKEVILPNRSRFREYFALSPLPHNVTHTPAEVVFLEKLSDTILTNLENTSLDVELLARMLNMSRSTLYRKVKVLSGLAPVEFINKIRLKKAAILLAEGDLKIYQVASMTGFSSQSNFTRSFQQHFKKTPSDYSRERQEERRLKNSSFAGSEDP